MSDASLNILFSGMIASDPGQGGAAWAVLQYVIGLRRLGHRLCIVEPIKREKIRSAPGDDRLASSLNASWFAKVISEFGLTDSAALLIEADQQTFGVKYDALRHFAQRADLLINVSGMLRDPELRDAPRRRVYLDLDPAFIQLWQDKYSIDMGLDGHTDFVTVGQNLGRSICPVPTCGKDWLATLPPVVLDEWPMIDANAPRRFDAFTTIANFRGYGSVELDGVFYGQKVHSLRTLMALPSLSSQRFTPALAIDPAEVKDLAALAENGWSLLDPVQVAGTPSDYRSFIQQSKAEIGIAKSGYVASRGGWFSDRSACYLASGRPVLAQDTGLADHLPLGAGLLTFDTVEQAADGSERIARDYAHHARAARSLAERYFDSQVVLSNLLERIGVNR